MGIIQDKSKKTFIYKIFFWQKLPLFLFLSVLAKTPQALF